MEEWFYTEKGETHGPYNENDFKDLFLSSKLLKSTYIWKKGFKDWEFAYKTDFYKKLNITQNKSNDLIPEISHFSKVTKRTKLFLYLNLTIAFILIISTYYENKLISDIKNGNYESIEIINKYAEDNDQRQSYIKICHLICLIISGILSLNWIYTANKNLQNHFNNMKYTPGWSVGWYFIPFFNLWKPFKAMKEIYEKSHNLNKISVIPLSVLRVWWFLWIFNSFLNILINKLPYDLNKINDLLKYNSINMFEIGIYIILIYVFVNLINKIFEMQKSYI